QSPQFRATLAQAGQQFAQAGVTHVLCIHGTFAGNDTLGLLTELQRYAPGLSERLRRMNKSAFDSVVGETGNYTAEYAATLQEGLNAGAERPIHVERCNWSSVNSHIGRADGAVRLINPLAQLSQQEAPDTPGPRQRVLLWAHSHG